MAKHTSERVNQLKEQFMELHAKGLSIAEIAEHCNLTTRSVYFHLQEIADSNHVSRESLLGIPHKQHAKRSSNSREDVDPKELTENFEKMIDNAKNIISEIDTILSSDEKQEEK